METFVNDTIRIDVDTSIDLTGYDNLVIKFRRPNGTIGRWTAAIDPSDPTHMFYTTDTNDLNIPGEWTLQAHAMDPVGLPKTLELHGKWATFTVNTPLADTTSPPPTAAPTTAVP